MSKYNVTLDNLFNKSNGLIVRTFFLIVLTAVSVDAIIMLKNLSSTILILIFVVFTAVCLFFKIKNNLRYLLCIIGFILFVVSFYVSDIPNYEKFMVLSEVSYYIPMLYAYLFKNIFFPIISGWGICLFFISLLNTWLSKDQIISNCVGIIVATIVITFVGYLIRKLYYQKDMYKALSKTDILTGVLNLDYMLERGDALISKGNKLTAYMFDINNFKEINDTFGHLIGNKILVQVARTLKEVIKDYDGTVGRLGGDEFIILTKNTDEESGNILLEKLNSALNNRYFESDEDLAPIKITCAIGMAHSNNGSITIQELLHLADMNMHYKKQERHGIIIDKDFEKVLSKDFKILLDVLCEKDVYSYIHSQYVVHYSTLLANELRLSKHEINDITLSAWLHDIGKLLVTNEILRKRSKLSDEEYSIIKRHVNYGLSILRDYNLSNNIIYGIQQHHERWDGKGYPLGIKGENTPIIARIIQIADSFSAMTIKRVYRDKMTLHDALEEIERCRGKQFDPIIAEKFIKLINREYKL